MDQVITERHSVDYDHLWYWRAKLPLRKGSPCRVVARSVRLGSVLVEFEDGFRVVTSRHAVRRPIEDHVAFREAAGQGFEP
jgi:hypothetical protein